MIEARHSVSINIEKAHYIYQKLHYSIEKGYTKTALSYLDELVDVLAGQDGKPNGKE